MLNSPESERRIQPHATSCGSSSARTRGQAVEERQLKRDVVGEAQGVAHLKHMNKRGQGQG